MHSASLSQIISLSTSLLSQSPQHRDWVMKHGRNTGFCPKVDTREGLAASFPLSTRREGERLFDDADDVGASFCDGPNEVDPAF